MNKLARRTIVGSAVVAAIVLVFEGGIALGPSFYNPDWNYGGEPTEEGHPDSKTNKEFDPKYTMLLYMDVAGGPGAPPDTTRIRAVRIQFLSKGWKQGTNTWENNQRRIAAVINYLNTDPNPAPVSSPNNHVYVYQNSTEMFFNQSHHVVIYVRDRNVKFDKAHPVWFGDRVMETDSAGKPKKAKANRSFFGAAVKTPRDSQNRDLIVGDYSHELVYMKNFFTGWKWWKGYYQISECDPHRYSLNMNAVLEVTGTNGGQPTSVPIIIDPDTGNSGGGEPTFIYH